MLHREEGNTSERERGGRWSFIHWPTPRWPQWLGLDHTESMLLCTSYVSAGTQVFKSFSTARPGLLTGSWIASGTAVSQISIYVECWDSRGNSASHARATALKSLNFYGTVVIGSRAHSLTLLE